MNTNEVKERIRLALSAYKENPNKIARRYNVNQKTLNNQINSDTPITLSTLLLIMNTCPEVSAEWLLRGIGEMTLTSQEPQTDNDTAVLKKEIELLRERIADKDSEIDFLKSLLKK